MSTLDVVKLWISGGTMRIIEDFSGAERQKASDRLRLVNYTNALKVGYKSNYWSVAFLLRLIDRVDETLANDPLQATGLAEGLPMLADRIPVRCPPERIEEGFYETEAEACGFRAWSHSVLSSAVCAVGRYEEARWEANKALSLARQAPKFARAEVLRRSALIELNLRNFDRALPMAEEAIELFTELRDPERLALARIGRGNALHLQNGPSAALLEFAEAIRCAADIRSRRAERAIVFAATNLSMCAALSPATDTREAYECLRLAMRTMNRRRYPLDLPKLTVRWTEAVLAYRFGAGRYSIRWLRKVRDGFLQRGAFRQAICCIADLLSVAKDQGGGALNEAASESLEATRQAIADSSPDQDFTEAFQTWASHPTDVEGLRRSLRKRQMLTRAQQ